MHLDRIATATRCWREPLAPEKESRVRVTRPTQTRTHWQLHILVPTRMALENVLLPLKWARLKDAQRQVRGGSGAGGADGPYAVPGDRVRRRPTAARGDRPSLGDGTGDRAGR